VTPADSGPKADEGQTFAEMVRACRVLYAAGLGWGAWGFLAIRDPVGRGVWVTRDGVGFDEITPGDLVLCSAGEVIHGVGDPDSETDVALDVLAARPDVHAVVHAHSLYATTFAATGRRLHAISHEGCHLVPPDVARTPLPGRSKNDSNAQSELVTLLGSRNSILLPGHGLITVAETVGEAVALAVYLEKACQLQLLSGSDVHVVPDVDVMEKRSGQVRRPQISWQYLQRTAP
jgi:ribulose-5-phosphate 4-epimerase/fuculose-1-phosphate aldolase